MRIQYDTSSYGVEYRGEVRAPRSNVKYSECSRWFCASTPGIQCVSASVLKKTAYKYQPEVVAEPMNQLMDLLQGLLMIKLKKMNVTKIQSFDFKEEFPQCDYAPLIKFVEEWKQKGAPGVVRPNRLDADT